MTTEFNKMKILVKIKMGKICLALLGLLHLGGCTSPEQSSVSKKILEPQLEALKATKNGHWQKAAELSEQWNKMAPNNYEANYQTATNYLRLNKPNKAITILKNYTSLSEKSEREVSWREARLAKAFYMTQQFEKVLEVVENYHFSKMYRGLAREHLKALIQLKRFEGLAKEFDHYKIAGIFRKNGKKTDTDFLFRAICNELVLEKNDSLLSIYAHQFKQWQTTNKSSHLGTLAFAELYLKNNEPAIKLLNKAIEEEKSPRHLMELEMLLGVCFAKKEILQQAESQIQKIHTMKDLPLRHDAFGATFYHQARIEAAMGAKEKAIQSLQKAIENRAEFWSNKFKEDGFLLPLFGVPAFEELVN